MITLNLELAEVNVVMAGLAKLTIEQGVATWQKILQQAQPQADAEAAKAADDTAKAPVLNDAPAA